MIVEVLMRVLRSILFFYRRPICSLKAQVLVVVVVRNTFFRRRLHLGFYRDGGTRGDLMCPRNRLHFARAFDSRSNTHIVVLSKAGPLHSEQQLA